MATATVSSPNCRAKCGKLSPRTAPLACACRPTSVSQDVLRMLTGPIVLTSANRSGQADAVTAQEVVQYLDGDVALVLDDGPCRYGQPSSVVRVKDNHFEILREGVVGEATLRRLAGVMVVVVCTGNTCRSPMAELLMRDSLAKSLKCTLDELDEQGVVVMSAGIAAAPGCPPAAEAVQVMREQGLDLSRHEAQPLTEQLVRHADLILAMTQSHLQSIVERWPESRRSDPFDDARPRRCRRPHRPNRRRLPPLCGPTHRRRKISRRTTPAGNYPVIRPE